MTREERAFIEAVIARGVRRQLAAKWDEGKLCMSRYPNESARRFDQQFSETTYERNARLRKARRASSPCPPDDASEAQCDAPHHMRNGVPYCEICGRERLSRMGQ